MNENLENTSERYQKLLLSASLKREAKENEEINNVKKQTPGNNENNDFIIYIEFKFENLILSRYLFDIRDELGTPIRNSVQITRFIIMRSENHIMGTCVSNRIILCYRNDKESNGILEKLKEELKRSYSICLTLENNIEDNKKEIEKYLLSYIIQFTLVCKYVECGKWVHIWDNMDTIIESKFCGNNTSKYFNCIGFKFHILNMEHSIINQKKNYEHIVKVHLKVIINIYKVLPVGENNMCENMYVYCLPRCSMRATILDVFDSRKDEKKFNYKNYWLNVHGYVLNENSVKKIIKVKLYKGVFNYPQGVLLRDNIYKLNMRIKKEHFFYICNFVNSFELLKKSQLQLLKYSDFFQVENIYDDLLLSKNKKKLKNEQDEEEEKEKEEDSDFYKKLNLICNNEYEGNKIAQEISHSNKQQNVYENSYNLYGNTLTNLGGMSINLNFSKNIKINKNDQKSSGSTTQSYHYTKNDLVDAFLNESALAYQSRGSYMNKEQEKENPHQYDYNDIQQEPCHLSNPELNECAPNESPFERSKPITRIDIAKKKSNTLQIHENVSKTKQTGTTVVHTRDNNLNIPFEKHSRRHDEIYKENQNKNKELDNHLHSIAKNYNSIPGNNSEHMTNVNMFENVNAQIIFSKEFQNFLDNLDEVALYQQEPLERLNFDQREKKRPNFLMNNPQTSETSEHIHSKTKHT
ncbi:hypothetical protein, conserved [Plasmodium gonderi]|uniref:Uncharacterized protein n=1 Tax=Plasmodium gonderi TaxID=77519 RepID=A0A1Y1JR17_PLAGO|nr:hypothetical protein, conserved [Plasmodium gonderi]GAW82474.1 hypothetical protein, conserved [Plasmodium gonderi]